MFDSREIAREALLRADEIKAEKERRRSLMRITALSGACVVCAAVVVLAFLMGRPPIDYVFIGDESVPLSAAMLPDISARPFNDGALENSLHFAVPGNGSITIPADTEEVKLTLLNPPENPCWAIFEIVLLDTGETIFMSGLVAPAMCIESITLSRPLAKGEYKATVVIRTFELESMTAMNGARVALDLIAE